MNRKRSRGTALVPGLTLLMAVALCLAGPTWGGQAISARYIQASGTQITWKIRIPYPAPAAMEVSQYLLPDSDILASSHSLSSYDRKKGMATWLISPLSPGVLKMEVTVSRPIQQKDEIHGQIRFLDESRQATAETSLEPRPVHKAFEGC